MELGASGKKSCESIFPKSMVSTHRARTTLTATLSPASIIRVGMNRRASSGALGRIGTMVGGAFPFGDESGHFIGRLELRIWRSFPAGTDCSGMAAG